MSLGGSIVEEKHWDFLNVNVNHHIFDHHHCIIKAPEEKKKLSHMIFEMSSVHLYCTTSLVASFIAAMIKVLLFI